MIFATDGKAEVSNVFDPRCWNDLYVSGKANAVRRRGASSDAVTGITPPTPKSQPATDGAPAPDGTASPDVSRSAGGIDDKRELWNSRASTFAYKKRSPYIRDLIAKLPLEPGDTVLDMGCGPGTLAVPLARLGHRVTAVDFSPRMLEELRAAAGDAGVEVEAVECSWQESWERLPQVDVVVASRSFAVDDFDDPVAKMESKARKFCVVTLPAGDSPWTDVLEAVGRSDPDRRGGEFVALVNYLLASGRFPRLDYIEYPHSKGAADLPELVKMAVKSVMPETPEEAEAVARYVREHARPAEGGGDGDGTVPEGGEKGGVVLDTGRMVRWGMVTWPVGDRDRDRDPRDRESRGC